VKTGATLVNQAGQSLTEIVGAIKKVSDIVAEIAAASREQSSGLEQVNTAIASMDEMTQRNGALVEETSASAQSLSNQAQDLAGLVQRYRLDDTAAPAPAPAASPRTTVLVVKNTGATRPAAATRPALKIVPHAQAKPAQAQSRASAPGDWEEF
jgi:methyl-accepting chemotaxis protein